MALYFQLIFGVLCTEIVALTLLLGPLPLFARHQLMKIQTSTGYVISSLSYFVKIALLGNAVLFVDSVQRVRKLTAEAALAQLHNPAQMQDAATSANFRSRKVYSQRNMYLTGFTLFLAFVLVRVFTLVANETSAEDHIRVLEASRETMVKQNADANGTNVTQKDRQQKAALDNLSKKAA